MYASALEGCDLRFRAAPSDCGAKAAGEMGGAADRQQESQWARIYLGCARPTTIPYPGFFKAHQIYQPNKVIETVVVLHAVVSHTGLYEPTHRRYCMLAGHLVPLHWRPSPRYGTPHLGNDSSSFGDRQP